ncbi:MAG: hypothetical protein IJV35_02930 [Neisseriaceae bacterium]|nr:hypothetical protein [Neisseriaceae bacterium]
MKKSIMLFSAIISSYCLAENYSQINENFALDETALVCDKTTHNNTLPCNTTAAKNQWYATGVSPYPPYDTFYIDEHSIQKINGSSALVTEQFVLEKSKQDSLVGKNYKVILFLMKYDCQKQRKFILSEKKYNKFGKHVHSVNYENFPKIKNDTGLNIEEKEYNVVCKR